MKKDWSHLDKFRHNEGAHVSKPGDTFGAFIIADPASKGVELRVIANDGSDPEYPWDHISCHAYDHFFKKVRTPAWEQMCFLKSLFWEEDECVIQYHPAKDDYVNLHPHVLHLWKSVKEPFPMPPKVCV